MKKNKADLRKKAGHAFSTTKEILNRSLYRFRTSPIMVAAKYASDDQIQAALFKIQQQELERRINRLQSVRPLNNAFEKARVATTLSYLPKSAVLPTLNNQMAQKLKKVPLLNNKR